MQPSDELLPCPFCAGKPIPAVNDHARMWVIRCSDCGCEVWDKNDGHTSSDFVQMINSTWNNRPALALSRGEALEDARAEVERLREALSRTADQALMSEIPERTRAKLQTPGFHEGYDAAIRYARAAMQELAVDDDSIHTKITKATQGGYARGLTVAAEIAETARGTEGVLHKPTQNLIAAAIRISATKARAALGGDDA